MFTNIKLYEKNCILGFVVALRLPLCVTYFFFFFQTDFFLQIYHKNVVQKKKDQYCCLYMRVLGAFTYMCVVPIQLKKDLCHLYIVLYKLSVFFWWGPFLVFVIVVVVIKFAFNLNLNFVCFCSSLIVCVFFVLLFLCIFRAPYFVRNSSFVVVVVRAYVYLILVYVCGTYVLGSTVLDDTKTNKMLLCFIAF